MTKKQFDRALRVKNEIINLQNIMEEINKHFYVYLTFKTSSRIDLSSFEIKSEQVIRKIREAVQEHITELNETFHGYFE